MIFLMWEIVGILLYVQKASYHDEIEILITNKYNDKQKSNNGN